MPRVLPRPRTAQPQVVAEAGLVQAALDGPAPAAGASAPTHRQTTVVGVPADLSVLVRTSERAVLAAIPGRTMDA
jgi:hypothetical protein